MVRGNNRPTQTACGVACKVYDQRNGACYTLQSMTLVYKYTKVKILSSYVHAHSYIYICMAGYGYIYIYVYSHSQIVNCWCVHVSGTWAAIPQVTNHVQSGVCALRGTSLTDVCVCIDAQ